MTRSRVSRRRKCSSMTRRSSRFAIDERRAFFRNHLWQRPNDPNADYGPKNVKQVWFPGVHCDVGGGYPESESGLSKIALDWMIEEGVRSGLEVNREKAREVLGEQGGRYARPDPNAPLHESLSGWWNLAELIPKKHYDWQTGKIHRKMNLWSRRTIPPNSLVHESAFQRDGYRGRFPQPATPIMTRQLFRLTNYIAKSASLKHSIVICRVLPACWRDFQISLRV
jgi:uncharacterized protein (DUF2235 family)